MPNAIKFTIGADSSQFAREMAKLEGQSVKASASIARTRQVQHEREVRTHQSREQSRIDGAAKYEAQRAKDTAHLVVSAKEKAYRSRSGGITVGSGMAPGLASLDKELEKTNYALFQKEKAYRERKASIMGGGGMGVAGGGFRAFAEREQAEISARGGGGGMYGGPRHKGGIGGASSAMFVSVARDSLASLASGANPMTVFLQQAPQVAQAFTMMGTSALKFFKTLLMNPFTWMIAGLVAIGSAIAFVVMHFNAVAQGLRNLKNITDFTNRSFVDQVSIIKSLVAAQREHVDWLKKQAEAEGAVATAADAAVEALKKKQELEMAAARKNSGSTDALEKKQAEEMLAALKAVQTEREAALKSAKEKARDANKANENFIGGTGPDTKSQMGEAEKAESLAAILADKAKAKMVESFVGTGEYRTDPGQDPVEIMRKANESDKFNIEHEGKTYPVSVNSAKALGDTARTEKQRLEELGRGIDKFADAARSVADVATKEKKDADKAVADQKHAVDLAAIGGATARGKTNLPITENQRIGAAIGGPQMTMLDIQRKHLTVAQQQYQMLKAGMSGGRRGVHFGGRR